MAAAHLRKNKLVEGRVTNLYLAAPLAKTTDDKAQYIKNKGFDDKYYQDMIIDYLEKFGKAERADMRKLFISETVRDLPHYLLTSFLLLICPI